MRGHLLRLKECSFKREKKMDFLLDLMGLCNPLVLSCIFGDGVDGAASLSGVEAPLPLSEPLIEG
jgi:hypothetical protein